MRIGRRLLPLMGLVIFAIALWALRREFEADSYPEILPAMEGIGSLHLLGALGLTALSFFILSGYDFLAVRSIGSDLPYRRVAMASYLGYAFSQALGFPLLTGTPIRFRLHTSWGFSAADVTRVVGFYTFTFWLGLATVGGVVFLGEPGLAEHVLHGPVFLSRTLGGLLLTPAVGYLAWAVLGRMPLRNRSFEFPVPGRRRALAQMALLGDKTFLFIERKNAFLMYGQEGRSWIVLGDPVGVEAEFPELMWQFRNLVHRHEGWPMFIDVTASYLMRYTNQAPGGTMEYLLIQLMLWGLGKDSNGSTWGWPPSQGWRQGRWRAHGIESAPRYFSTVSTSTISRG